MISVKKIKRRNTRKIKQAFRDYKFLKIPNESTLFYRTVQIKNASERKEEAQKASLAFHGNLKHTKDYIVLSNVSIVYKK